MSLDDKSRMFRFLIITVTKYNTFGARDVPLYHGANRTNSDIKLTMMYSHLSPQFMQKVVEINPLTIGYGCQAFKKEGVIYE